jgi:hypothetical protein
MKKKLTHTLAITEFGQEEWIIRQNKKWVPVC